MINRRFHSGRLIYRGAPRFTRDGLIKNDVHKLTETGCNQLFWEHMLAEDDNAMFCSTSSVSPLMLLRILIIDDTNGQPAC
ncbi:hypothetical protein [Budvicia aquatica]|uniref:Uncharacterized protein n=1 Tax=Budvicia aquatica TaxID=82979 RepID=A0A2C6DV95_9GAMM|nr:hypothetical protein [Budvicia aquatica]PHI32252.1 hypothetical protein CRN84_24490 [Budvicia aquatica]VFS45169.1 Uncharacterised protein [Budvicia aquatica]